MTVNLFYNSVHLVFELNQEGGNKSTTDYANYDCG